LLTDLVTDVVTDLHRTILYCNILSVDVGG
jgi:hypothetical protein